MNNPDLVLFEAIAFASKAHRSQTRKDGTTPYISHVVRTMAVACTVFGVTDKRVLAAAVLHDTIEDTTTDYDDLAERFGTDIADWVSALSKEKHLPDAEREARYRKRLAAAPYQVVLIKLADVYDNINDSMHLPEDQQSRTAWRAREYLDALRGNLPPEAAKAFELTSQRMNVLDELLTK